MGRLLDPQGREARLALFSFLVEQSRDVSTLFQGDVRMFVIACLIEQATLIRLEAIADGSPCALLLSATELSSASGIPRETVRRKLEALAKLGWLISDGAGKWKLASLPGSGSRVGTMQLAARRDLQEFQVRTMARISTLLTGLMEHSEGGVKRSRTDRAGPVVDRVGPGAGDDEQAR
jgi:DNA-binding transcriptional ArsR family regulator